VKFDASVGKHGIQRSALVNLSTRGNALFLHQTVAL
jgi:hypothetical protein